MPFCIARIKNTQIVRECRVLVAGASGASPMDLRVTATPITVGGEPFVVAAIEDISQTKRLDVLQRVFFPRCFEYRVLHIGLYALLEG